MEKYVREDGKVAVLYSPGWGAGWSTWNGESAEDREFLIFDKTLVSLVLADNRQGAEELAEQRIPDFYGGGRDLTICWLEPGTKFRITEYDGAEYVELLDQTKYHTA